MWLYYCGNLCISQWDLDTDVNNYKNIYKIMI